MTITQQDAEDIINRMSNDFLNAVNNTYRLNRTALVNRILLLNNMYHVVAPNKDKIDLAIMGSPEDNEYYQYYFLIVEEGKLTPHHIERLERRKIEQNISTNSNEDAITTNEIETNEPIQENRSNKQNITKNNNTSGATRTNTKKRKAANKKPTKPNSNAKSISSTRTTTNRSLVKTRNTAKRSGPTKSSSR